MANTEQQVIQTIEQLSNVFKNDSELEKLEKANEQNQKVIARAS